MSIWRRGAYGSTGGWIGSLPVTPASGGFVVDVVTLFPEMFPGSLGLSLAGKALEDGLWSLESVDIRGFARDKHRTVDDSPFGGGAGMVLRPDVLDAAIGASHVENTPLIYLTPRGRLLADAVGADILVAFESAAKVTVK